MSKYFSVSGYFKDDINNPFSDYIIKEFDDFEAEKDDNIFFYGLSEEEIKNSIDSKGNDSLDFVITDYKLLN